MKTYTIKKGSHYSWHIPKFWIGKKNSISMEFRFYEECWFPMRDRDDYAINKLCGWSYGFHHRNSIRVGWTPSDTRKSWIDLYAYYYKNGERGQAFIGTVECGTFNKVQIEYDIKFNTVSCSLRRTISEETITFYAEVNPTWWGVFLFPFFGGRKTAAVNTRIDLSFE